MAVAAVGRDVVEGSTCWCCGNRYPEAELTRLGSHPEVGVCERCARWLHRRARAARDEDRRSLGPWARRRFADARGQVMRHHVQDWPVLGPLLKRLDRYLP
jgi:hypothetical protein